MTVLIEKLNQDLQSVVKGVSQGMRLRLTKKRGVFVIFGKPFL